MNADGSDPTPLAGDPRSSAAPTFSPDGKRIVFAVSGVRDGPGIYVMNADGSDRHQLADTRDGDGAPDWSPASDG